MATVDWRAFQRATEGKSSVTDEPRIRHAKCRSQLLKPPLPARAIAKAQHLRGLVLPKDRFELQDRAMDREDGVELFNNNRVDSTAFQALSRRAADQPVGYVAEARDVLQLPETRLVDFRQHFRRRTGQSNRTLKITMPPMLDGSVDLPHRGVSGTGLDVMRVADRLFLTLDASPCWCPPSA